MTADGPVSVLAGPRAFFRPNVIVVKAGAPVTLNMPNCDSAQHSFVSPSLGVANKVDIPVGADAKVTFNAPTAPGKYMFWCSEKYTTQTHAEAGMTGEIIVQ